MCVWCNTDLLMQIVDNTDCFMTSNYELTFANIILNKFTSSLLVVLGCSNFKSTDDAFESI